MVCFVHIIVDTVHKDDKYSSNNNNNNNNNNIYHIIFARMYMDDRKS